MQILYFVSVCIPNRYQSKQYIRKILIITWGDSMCALKKARKIDSIIENIDYKVDSEVKNQKVVENHNNIGFIHKSKTSVGSINIKNVIKPYSKNKEELISKHPCFKWLKWNIKHISNDALKCYASNLVMLGEFGRKYFMDIISERAGALIEYKLFYSDLENNHKKGDLKIASYEVLSILGYNGETFGGNSPAEEIMNSVQEEYEKELGLMKSPKGSYYINTNIFQRYFFSRVNIFKYNDEYYIYDLSGYYIKTDVMQIKKIAKVILHEVKNDIWNAKMEKDIWNALNLEIPIVLEINSYKEYINFNNGMYNIYSKKLERHDPKFLSTIRIAINHNESAKCPIFKKFLHDLMQGDEERILLSEEVIGYCITTLKCIQKGFFFYGTGGNGKSKFADVISNLCGKQNVSNMPLEVLGTRFGAETLPNKLVNISPENEFNRKYMNTSTFKSITGGDTMYIDAKHKTGKSRDVFAKLISLLNKLPDTNDTSNGYFRRVLIIPFYNVFNGENDDKEIVDKLLNELEGILIVALDGLSRLIDNKFNFTESKVVNEIFNQYKVEQNPVEEFFKDKIVCRADVSIKQCDILKQFKKWSMQNGYDDWNYISSTKFWNLFRKVLVDNAISYQNTKKIKGITYIIGITIE